MKIALKIDVDTYRGTREGVPRLLETLQRHQAGATFLFSLGPDHTGRAVRRAFRPGFMKKVSRTSVLEHYGIVTLLYGTLLPGPDIGVRCADILRSVRDAGFETGVHTWDHVKWQDGVTDANAAWTLDQMRRACDRYEQIFGERPHVHGAAGWQMNRHSYRLTQEMGFQYCSDSRGSKPFIPVINGELIDCPQLPTTLPTLDELIGVDDITVDNVADHQLRLSADRRASGHVYTLHAELEGMKLLPVFERLLEGWRAAGHELVSLHDYHNAFEPTILPRHVVINGEIAGRSGTLSLQKGEFLADAGT